MKPVLRSWRSLIARYRLQQPDDAPYYYNERATLSVLAGAVWNTQNVALEEFRTSKNGKTAHGRADLWFRVGKQQVLAEAKQIWPAQLRNLTDQVAAAKRGAERSFGQVSRALQQSLRLSLVFVCPRVHASKTETFSMESWGHEARSVSPDLYASWNDPGSTWPNWMRVESHYFPAVMMLGWFE